MIKILLFFNLFICLNLYSQDGSLDTNFNVGTGANGNVYVIKQLNNNKIIIGGQFTSYNGYLANGIARLNSDGSLDVTFNSGTGIDFLLQDLLIEDDGKMVIVGQFSNYNGTPRNCIARINSDGTLDNSFNVSFSGILGVESISKQNDKYIITGKFGSVNGVSVGNIARLNIDGTTDTSFNSTGYSGSATVGAKNYIQSDGKIMLVGSFIYCFNQSLNRIARLNSDGTLDTTFNPGGGASNNITSLSIQADGKYIISGLFATYNGINMPLIARINIDGSLDSTFNTDSGYGVAASTLLNQMDGKILAGGWLTSAGGNGKYLVRLNTDGSFDNSFDTGNNFDNSINVMSLQSDGKILVGGWFSHYNNIAREKVLRLNNQLLGINILYEQKSKIYPNPTKDILNIQIDNINKINILDLTGKTILSKEKSDNINVSQLQTGMYIVKIESEGKFYNEKFIKE